MSKKLASLALILCVTEAFSQDGSEDDSDNFRGKCRKLVSGVYADAWNESIRSKDALVAAESALNRLRPQLTMTERKLRDHVGKMKREPFNSESANKREELSAQEKVIHDQINTAQDVYDHAKNSNKISQQKHSDLTQLIDKVFYRKFVPDPEGLPKKIFHKLEWKTPCPKYRSLCPLPEESAAHLKKLSQKIDDSESVCSKYAAYR